MAKKIQRRESKKFRHQWGEENKKGASKCSACGLVRTIKMVPSARPRRDGHKVKSVSYAMPGQSAKATKGKCVAKAARKVA